MSAELIQLAEFRDTIESYVPFAIGTLVNPSDDVKSYAESFTYDILIHHAEFYDGIRASIPSIIIGLQVPGFEGRKRRIDALAILYQFSLKEELRDAIGPAIPTLVQLLGDDFIPIQDESLRIFTQLANQTSLHEAIRIAAPALFALFMDGLAGGMARGSTLGNARQAIEVMLSQEDLRWTVVDSIPGLVSDLLEHMKAGTSFEAGEIIIGLATIEGLSDAFRPLIPSILELLNDSRSNSRRDAVSIIDILARHRAVAEAIPSLVERFEDEESEIRRGAVMAFMLLAAYGETEDPIRAGIPRLINLLEDQGREVQYETIDAVVTLARQFRFRDTIKDSIPLLDLILKGQDERLRSAASWALITLFEHNNWRHEIAATIPLAVEAAVQRDETETGNHFWKMTDAATMLASLPLEVDFQDVVLPTVPVLIESLKEKDNASAPTIMRTLEKWAVYVNFRSAIQPAVPVILGLLPPISATAEYPISSSIYQAILTLQKLSEYSEFTDSFVGGLDLVLKASQYQDLQFSSLAIFVNLAAYAGGRDAILPFVHSVINVVTSDGRLREAMSNDVFRPADFIAELATHPGLRRNFLLVFPNHLENLNGIEASAQVTTLLVGAKLADYPEFASLLRAHIPTILRLLIGEREYPSDLSDALGKLISHAGLRGANRELVIPLLATWLSSSSAHAPAVYALATFAQYADLRDGIRTNIQSLITLIQSVSSQDDSERIKNIRTALPGTLLKLAQYGELRNPLLGAVQAFGELLKNQDVDVQSSTVTALAELAEYPEFRDAIRRMLPQFMALPADSLLVGPALLSAFIKVAKHVELRAGVPILELVIRMRQRIVRNNTLEILTGLAEYDEFRLLMKSLIFNLVNDLQDEPTSQTVALLAMLAKQSELQEEIRGNISRRISALTQSLKEEGSPEQIMARFSIMPETVKAWWLVSLREAVRLYEGVPGLPRK